MKKDLLEKIEIPENVNVEISGSRVRVKANGREVERKFDVNKIGIKKQGNEIIIESKKATKRESKNIGTIVAHIKNMIKGVTEGFEYKLEVAFVHFPMTVEVAGNKLLVKNFLGEKKPRICEILEGTEVEVSGNFLTVRSHDKELAGQMSANIEKTTKVRGKDTRKFQDGVYITEKPGREI